MILNVLKVLIPVTLSFFIGIGLTPALTHYLYKNKMWKKKAGKVDPYGAVTPIFNALHAEKEVGTPRLGGVVIWGSVLLTVLVMSIISIFLPSEIANKLQFLSRSQTWVPFATLIFASLVGLIDDWYEIHGGLDGRAAGGMSFRKRLLIVLALGAVIACWFYFKLEMYTV